MICVGLLARVNQWGSCLLDNQEQCNVVLNFHGIIFVVLKKFIHKTREYSYVTVPR